ncbi:MAG TPA: hypothetical protein VNU97_19260 [Rhizomicrobium sp.]|jgi:hypothetical protein|nr:hypothetical protein [Rhizomicrobium sp.]
MRPWLTALAILVSLATPAAGDEPGALRAAAQGFYGVYETFHPSSGIPGDADRARYRPYVSPALDALLKQAGDAEARFARANKDSPPLVEGDLFSSLFEGATGVALGACSGDDRNGQCAVNLTYADPGDKPTSWTDTVYLVNTPLGWRVDDIGFGGSWAFGNKGKLSDTLRQVAGFP